MKIIVHFPGELNEAEAKAVKAGILRGVERAQARGAAPREDVNVHIFVRPDKIAPGLCVGGGTMDNNAFGITLDKAKIFDPKFEDDVSRLFNHELCHIEREQAGHKVVTLGDAHVSEGLALAAELASEGSLVSYAHFANNAQRLKFATHAYNHLDDVLGDGGYMKWFFGEENNWRYSPMAAYKLSYEMASGYMIANNIVSLKDIMNLPAAAVIHAWKTGAFRLNDGKREWTPMTAQDKPGNKIACEWKNFPKPQGKAAGAKVRRRHGVCP